MNLARIIQSLSTLTFEQANDCLCSNFRGYDDCSRKKKEKNIMVNVEGASIMRVNTLCRSCSYFVYDRRFTSVSLSSFTTQAWGGVFRNKKEKNVAIGIASLYRELVIFSYTYRLYDKFPITHSRMLEIKRLFAVKRSGSLQWASPREYSCCQKTSFVERSRGRHLQTCMQGRMYCSGLHAKRGRS